MIKIRDKDKADFKINELLINISTLNPYHTTIHAFSDNSEKICAEKGFSFGEIIKKALEDFSFPSKLKSCRLIVDNDFYRKLNLGQYIIKFAGDTNAEVISWKTKDSIALKNESLLNDNAFQATLANVNPNALIGAIVASIKDNSAALGKDGALLKIGEIENNPELVKYIRQFQQRKL